MATVYNTLRCGLYPFKHQLVTGLLKFLNLVKLQCLLPAVRFMRLFFRMPFFAVYGDKDNCMITFLDNIGLQKRIIRKSKFPPNPERSVQFSGKRTKRSVQKIGCTQHL